MFRFETFASSYIMTCVERLSYIFLWERNPSAVSLKMPSDSVVWVLVRVSAVMQLCKWKRAETLVLGRINLNYTAMRGPTIHYVRLLLLAVS